MRSHPLPACCLRLTLGLSLGVLLSLLLGACASSALDEADRHARAGAHQQAYATLQAAAIAKPADPALRAASLRQRERLVLQGLAQADLARANGRLDDAHRALDRVRALDPAHPRIEGMTRELERAARHEKLLAEARSRLTTGQRAAAEAKLRELLSEAPAHGAARTLLATLVDAGAGSAAAGAANPAPATALGPAFQQPVVLEFRDAPLRQVFEALARTTAINFVFDKDTRVDGRITIFLRNVTLDEALRIVLSTQGLGHKLLNDSTLLIYPNTQAKQREHLELVTRSLYLVNADARQALALVRTMAKTRDLHADERLNALVVRDTPEVVRMVEQLIATIDLPEPEVLLEVEVMEVASDRIDELGLKWPDEIQYAVPGATGLVPVRGSGWRAMIATPGLVASLRGNTGATNLLANPTIRARNREKAKVQIGEKLPVFTTTSTANVGVSTSVSYLDVGLKLDVEPSVHLDGDVTIKIALEVSNLLREVPGPAGTLAYQVGTRLTTTSLRLHDGETQVIAGLINDEERKRANGLPGLAELPFVGRLFGVHSDNRAKTEIVMLITPRIVRNLVPPSVRDSTLAAGTDSQPGAPTLRLQAQARATLGPAAAGRGETAAPAAVEAAAPATAPAALVLAASAQAAVGEPASVTLVNRSGYRVRGELAYDDGLLHAASTGSGGGGSGNVGRIAFAIEPRGEFVAAFRPRAAAAGQTVEVAVVGLEALTAAGVAVSLAIEGDARIAVAAGTPAPAAPASTTPGAPAAPATPEAPRR